MNEGVTALFRTEGFLPQGQCYLWNSGVVGLHGISDGLIVLACYTIPFLLVYFVRKRQDVPFPSLFWLFALLILGCGTIHLLEIWTLWYPAYWAAGLVKLITGIVAVATVLVLIPTIPQALALLNTDITERKRMEEALQTLNAELERRVAEQTHALQQSEAAERTQREYFQVTLASIGDGVIVTDSTGGVTFLNHVAEEMTGWTTADATGKPLPVVFHIINEETRHVVEDPVAKVLRTNVVAGLANHTVLCTKDGRELPIDDSAAPIRDEQGRLLGIVLVFRDITARRQVEAALRESRDQLEVILHGIADGVTAQLPNGQLLYANDAAARIIGYPSVSALLQAPLQEVMQQFEVLDEEGRPFPFSQLPGRRALQGEQQPEALLRFRIVATGENHWSLVKATPISDERGVVRFAVNIFHDITAMKQAEEALRQSEARYRVVSELVSDYAYAVRIEPNDRRVLEWVTEAFSRITGFTVQELEAREGVAWLIHPEDMPAVQQRLRVLFSGQPGFSEHRIITKSGEVRWLRDYSSPEVDAVQGRVVRIIGAGQDITEHKQAEEALRESEHRWHTLAEALPALVWMARPDGFVDYFNHRWFDYTGMANAQLAGWGWEATWHPEDLSDGRARWLECLRTGEPYEYEVRLRRAADVRYRWHLIRAVPQRDPAGRILRWFGTTTDIEEQKHTAAELQRVNTELQHFAYIVSHDLNEPLRTMRNYVQLLERRTKEKLDVAAQEYMNFILEAAERMQQMLSDLLAYTRAGRPPAFTAVDCEVVLARVLRALHTRITECGAVITHDPLPTVQGDATRLGQVFQNLIGNALKFCEARPPRIHLTVQREDRHWRFAVQDNGIGIDPTHVERIFQVFQRLHTRSEYTGTGIGLAICKKIIEQHGGHIWVDSRPGEGSIFYFTISDFHQNNTPLPRQSSPAED